MTIDLKAALAEAEAEHADLLRRLDASKRVLDGLRLACGVSGPAKGNRARDEGARARMREAIARQRGTFRFAEVLKAAGASHTGHVSNILNEMLRNGEIVRLERGLYAAADANGHAEPERAEVVA